MTDATQGNAKTDADTAPANRGRRANEPETGKLKGRSDAVRSKVATVVWLVAVICALFLAVGALLMALQAKETNPVVQFITDMANRLDGPLHDIFDLEKKNQFDVEDALVNWGIAAVVYLVIGKILDRVIRP